MSVITLKLIKKYEKSAFVKYCSFPFFIPFTKKMESYATVTKDTITISKATWQWFLEQRLADDRASARDKQVFKVFNDNRDESPSVLVSKVFPLCHTEITKLEPYSAKYQVIHTATGNKYLLDIDEKTKKAFIKLDSGKLYLPNYVMEKRTSKYEPSEPETPPEDDLPF